MATAAVEMASGIQPDAPHFSEFGSGSGRRPAHGAGLSAGRLAADFDHSFRERSGGGLAGTPISYVVRD
jgi:hypothetical protein